MTDSGKTANQTSNNTAPENGDITWPHNMNAARQPPMMYPYVYLPNTALYSGPNWQIPGRPNGAMVPPPPPPPPAAEGQMPNGNGWMPGMIQPPPPPDGSLERPNMKAPLPSEQGKANGDNDNSANMPKPPHGSSIANRTIGHGSTTSRHFTSGHASSNLHGSATPRHFPMAFAPFATGTNGGTQQHVPRPGQQNPGHPLALRDRQFMNLIEARDIPLYMTWNKQLSKNVMSVLCTLQVFILAGTAESSCPYSQFVRRACNQFLYGDEESPGDRITTGLCCSACLQRLGWSRPDFVQFIDFHDDEEMFHAMMKLYWHTKFCPFAQKRTPVLKRRSFSIQYESDSLGLKAFANWYCEYIHENDAIEKGLVVPPPSLRQRELAANAILRYLRLEKAWDEAFEDIESALSQSRRANKGRGVLASDLTEIPSEGSLTEFSFYLLLLEHIEVVIVSMEYPGHLKDLLEHEQAESLVLFQCKCCHGKSCLGKESAVASTKERPYVVYRNSQSQRSQFVCEMIELAFHHFQACPEVPLKNKQRLRRVMPSTTSSDFDDFDSFSAYFQQRVVEWDKYVRAELDNIKLIENVAPYEGVPLWQPINDLIEGGDSMRSVYTPAKKRAAGPRLPSDGSDNDVLEGFDGAREYVGNRRFRKLVGSLRDDFFSTTNPAEREVVNMQVFDRIKARGGRFRRFDSDGIWRELSRSEAANRCRTALEKGFESLLIQQPRTRHLGPGANVLETEIAPQYDLLSGRKRGPIVTKAPVCVIRAQSPPPKRQSVDPRCRAVADI